MTDFELLRAAVAHTPANPFQHPDALHCHDDGGLLTLRVLRNSGAAFNIGNGMTVIFTVIATDLEPGALPAGLTRDELWEKLKGHAKGVAGTVGLFKR